MSEAGRNHLGVMDMSNCQPFMFTSDILALVQGEGDARG